jgi:hypothetical protein
MTHSFAIFDRRAEHILTTFPLNHSNPLSTSKKKPDVLLSALRPVVDQHNRP